MCVVGKKRWGRGTREEMGGRLPHFFVPRADLISDLRDDSEGDKTDDICSERGTHSPHPDFYYRITPSYVGQPRKLLSLVVSEKRWGEGRVKAENQRRLRELQRNRM